MLTSSTAVKKNKKRDGKEKPKRGWKKGKEKARALPWGKLCQDRPVVLLLHGCLNKSILIRYIINNNLIKNPKYSIV